MSSYTLDDLIQERQRTHNFEINDFKTDPLPEQNKETPKLPARKLDQKIKEKYLSGLPNNENSNITDDNAKTSMLPIVVVSALLLFVLVK